MAKRNTAELQTHIVSFNELSGRPCPQGGRKSSAAFSSSPSAPKTHVSHTASHLTSSHIVTLTPLPTDLTNPRCIPALFALSPSFYPASLPLVFTPAGLLHSTSFLLPPISSARYPNRGSATEQVWVECSLALHFILHFSSDMSW